MSHLTNKSPLQNDSSLYIYPPQEKACLLTCDSSQDSDSSIYFTLAFLASEEEEMLPPSGLARFSSSSSILDMALTRGRVDFFFRASSTKWLIWVFIQLCRDISYEQFQPWNLLEISNLAKWTLPHSSQPHYAKTQVNAMKFATALNSVRSWRSKELECVDALRAA